jgi:hypothetical protein
MLPRAYFFLLLLLSPFASLAQSPVDVTERTVRIGGKGCNSKAALGHPQPQQAEDHAKAAAILNEYA